MKYSVRHIGGNKYQINLIPDSPEEHKTIQTLSHEYLEMYYHEAVSQHLGPNASLLSIDSSLDRYSVIGKVEHSRGIGGF